MDFEEMRGAYLRATEEDILNLLRYSTMNDGAEKIYTVMTQAADEIEQLRKENIELRSEIQRITPQIGY